MNTLYIIKGIREDKLQESVYEQWLVGDLAMLEEPVLDKVIKDDRQFVGTHALQVLSSFHPLIKH